MSKLDEVKHRFEWDAAGFAAIYRSDSPAFRWFNRVFRKAIFARYEIAMRESGDVSGKSILDIALTLEYLETLGVPVVVVGSDEFPAFYSRSSGQSSPRRVDDAKQAAAVLDATWRHLRLSRGVCIANPIAVEDEIPAAEIDGVIAEALAELSAQGITGQAVTPFLLSRIVDQTGGRSLTANVSLVKRNAALAADVAVEYSRIAK